MTKRDAWVGLAVFLAAVLISFQVVLTVKTFNLARDDKAQTVHSRMLDQASLQATHALCALRADLQHRVDSSEAFLKTHPQGFAGVPAATIESTLNGQRRTILALSQLHC